MNHSLARDFSLSRPQDVINRGYHINKPPSVVLRLSHGDKGVGSVGNTALWDHCRPPGGGLVCGPSGAPLLLQP